MPKRKLISFDWAIKSLDYLKISDKERKQIEIAKVSLNAGLSVSEIESFV